MILKAIAMAASWFSFMAAATCFKYFVNWGKRDVDDIVGFFLLWGGIGFSVAAMWLSIAVVVA